VKSMGEPYEVHFSAHIARQVRDLHAWALRNALGDIVVTTFEAAMARLQSNPTDFGEPLYRLPALRMQLRCAVVPPLIIHFGVCEDRATVYVKGVESLGE
jgi:hypothetical protein